VAAALAGVTEAKAAPVLALDSLHAAAPVPVPCSSCGKDRDGGTTHYVSAVLARARYDAAASAAQGASGSGAAAAVTSPEPAGSVQLCDACFNVAAWPSYLARADFVAIGEREAAAWTEEETLLLLEALEQQEEVLGATTHDDEGGSCSGGGGGGGGGGADGVHGYDWGAVAKQVGSKTAVQCLVRFLQLPVQLQADAAGVATSTGTAHSGGVGGAGATLPVAASSTRPLNPLADASHPAMHALASVLSATTPTVLRAALAAARASHGTSTTASAPAAADAGAGAGAGASVAGDGDVDMKSGAAKPEAVVGGGGDAMSVQAAVAVSAVAIRAKVSVCIWPVLALWWGCCRLFCALLLRGGVRWVCASSL